MAAAAVVARARGAVLGCLVGDAAATPVHWVYDPAKLAAHVAGAKRGPAFCDPPGNSFYTTRPGGLSCYGDQTLVLLESLVECGGRLDVEDYSRRLASKFGKESPYELEAVDPENWPQLKKNPTDADGKVIEEQRVWSMPLPGPWRHGSIKAFLTKYVTEGKRFPECGSDDAQVDGCCKVAPLVALFAGHKDMLALVDRAVRVTQNTDVASGFACGFARILEKLILGEASSVEDAIAKVKVDLEDPARSFKTAADETVFSSLLRVMDFTGTATGDVGKALKPEESSFPFAGLS
eukprot:TRINITY_DN47671_c0_g1_i1.p1 TRINITY_DN47671_c0_g1~~TRINITY_DN47671_c0_g1_i1.p1  ORF type:complete len:293 (+),score=41.16 TRINITY_DN47671_c0_g1_i1:27-905(+)